MHGHKRWELWPPAEATYAQQHVESALARPRAAAAAAAAAGADAEVAMMPAGLVCEQLPGEVLLVPHAWGHATVNLAPSIGWASEVNFDRVYDDGLDVSHGREWWRTGAEPADRGGGVDDDDDE